MNPMALITHMIPSAIIVISFFVAVRCLFVHEMRLEAWRAPVKHRIYIDRVTFKRLILAIGCFCLLVFLIVTYQQVLTLLER